MDGRPVSPSSPAREAGCDAPRAISLAVLAALVLGGWDGCGTFSRAPTGVKTVVPTVTPERHAWIVGDGGAVEATRTGGASWNPQASGTAAGLNDATFTDGRNGWAVGYGDNGVILATQDGGSTWSTQDADRRRARRRRVQRPDARLGRGIYGAIIATAAEARTGVPALPERASGCTTSPSATPGTAGRWAPAASSWPPATAAAPGALSRRARSTTSRASRAPTRTTPGRSAPTAPSSPPRTAARPGLRRPRERGADLWAVTFVDPAHGWAVGWDDDSGSVGGVILATETAARSGRSRPRAATSGSTASPSATPTHGWAVGRNIATGVGSILATKDGGAAWTVQKTGVGTVCNGVAARRVFTPGGASSVGSARAAVAGPSLALTWENGIVSTRL